MSDALDELVLVRQRLEQQFDNAESQLQQDEEDEEQQVEEEEVGVSPEPPAPPALVKKTRDVPASYLASEASTVLRKIEAPAGAVALPGRGEG